MPIAHALVALTVGLVAVVADVYVMPARVWLVVVWLWLVWPLSLALHPERSLKRVAVPSLIGLAILAPCIPMAFAFTAWSIEGFAPRCGLTARC